MLAISDKITPLMYIAKRDTAKIELLENYFGQFRCIEKRLTKRHDYSLLFSKRKVLTKNVT